jgi:hypothetical protein
LHVGGGVQPASNNPNVIVFDKDVVILTSTTSTPPPPPPIRILPSRPLPPPQPRPLPPPPPPAAPCHHGQPHYRSLEVNETLAGKNETRNQTASSPHYAVVPNPESGVKSSRSVDQNQNETSKNETAAPAKDSTLYHAQQLRYVPELQGTPAYQEQQYASDSVDEDIEELHARSLPSGQPAQVINFIHIDNTTVKNESAANNGTKDFRRGLASHSSGGGHGAGGHGHSARSIENNIYNSTKNVSKSEPEKDKTAPAAIGNAVHTVKRSAEDVKLPGISAASQNATVEKNATATESNDTATGDGRAVSPKFQSFLDKVRNIL